MKKRIWKELEAVFLAATVIVSSLSGGVSARAAEIGSVTYTSESGDYVFDKLSHPDQPVSSPDGIVDYLGNGVVGVGEENGAGDRGQSYSWAAASYGDYVYVGTCYAAMGNTLKLMDSVLGDKFDVEKMEATLNALFNGTFFYGQEDGADSEGVLVKVNVKTGETKLLMSKSLNGKSPLFRNALRFHDKLYFCGSVSDSNAAVRVGLPCIYEVDPETDEFRCIYTGITLQEYGAAYREGICTGIRGMTEYDDRLVISCVGLEGPYILISSNPSEGASSFTKIATKEDLFN